MGEAKPPEGQTPRDPVTPRGERMRARLLTAAREVFEERGYFDSKLSDITSAAGCSTGTFYLYFTDKNEILHVILEMVKEEMLHPAELSSHDDGSIREHISRSNRAYLESYRRNAAMMRLLNQVSAIDPQFMVTRRRRSEAFVQRNARAITNLQERGLADPTLNPYAAAKALSAMVSRTAFNIFCCDGGMDMDLLVETCTTLWVNALKIPDDA